MLLWAVGAFLGGWCIFELLTRFGFVVALLGGRRSVGWLVYFWAAVALFDCCRIDVCFRTTIKFRITIKFRTLD